MAAKAGVWVSDEEEAAPVLGKKFDPAASTVLWRTRTGGGGKFVGRGSGVVGAGGHLIHLDDPIKGEKEASLENTIEETWGWMNGQMFTRKEPGGSIIVSHHRWADTDPIGRLNDRTGEAWGELTKEQKDMLASVQWEYQEYPAVTCADNDDPIKADPVTDELFVPEEVRGLDGWRWHSRAELLFAKVNDPRTWGGMFQQRPPAGAGKLFPESFAEWEPWVDRDGIHGLIVQEEFVPVPRLDGKTLVWVADTAASESLGADWTALGLMALSWPINPQVNEQMMVAEVLRIWFERLESPAVIEFVANKVKSLDRSITVAYENKGEGRTQLQFLRRDHPWMRVVPMPASASKRVRAMSAAGGAEGGRLLLPAKTSKNSEWLEMLRRQLKRFTGAQREKDDGVDAVAIGWNYGLKLAPPMKGMVGGREIGKHLPRGEPGALGAFRSPTNGNGEPGRSLR